MKYLNRMRLLANQIIRPAGFEICRINRCTMGNGLTRISEKWDIRSILDIGAAKGDWAKLATKAFPNANILMVEALEERRQELNAYAGRHASGSKKHVHIGAVGERDGEVSFLVMPDLDGSAIVRNSTPCNKELRIVPMTTVDGLVDELGLKAPYLLKLDTHGYEVPILEGATRTLNNTAVVIIEVYTIRPLNDPRLLFWETCDYMARRGFRCFDCVDPLLRVKDGVLWQMDLFFTRAEWPPFKDDSWL